MKMPCCNKSRLPDTRWSWVVCVSATLSNLLHFGFAQSFGVFLPVLSDHFKVGRERTAWAGSLALSFILFIAPIAVKLSQRFGHRLVTIAAGLGCAISLITSSFATDITILYFTYGLVFGISAGSTLNTGFTIATRYFKKNRALATGIVASGSSVGVMIINPIAEKLMEIFGWRNTFRVMGGMMLLVCFFASTYDPIQVDSGHAGPVIVQQKPCCFFDCTVFLNASYTVGLISICLTFFGLYVPTVHLVRFALDLDISSEDASFLFIYVGIASTVSRVIVGRVIDKKWLTALHVVQLFSLILGISIILFSLAKQYSHFVVFSVVYGLINGGFITSHTMFLQSIVKPEKSAIGLGMGYMVKSIAVAGGPPFVGFMADELGNYIVSYYIIGGIMVLSAAIPFLLRCPRCRKDGAGPEKVEIDLRETNVVPDQQTAYYHASEISQTQSQNNGKEVPDMETAYYHDVGEQPNESKNNGQEVPEQQTDREL